MQNLPQELAKGVDTQLDRAIAEVMRLHAEHPAVTPNFAPVRIRTRDAFKPELTRP